MSTELISKSTRVLAVAASLVAAATVMNVFVGPRLLSRVLVSIDVLLLLACLVGGVLMLVKHVHNGAWPMAGACALSGLTYLWSVRHVEAAIPVAGVLAWGLGCLLLIGWALLASAGRRIVHP